MARGKLSEKEIRILKRNKQVIDVDEKRIIYSNEFKELFIKEYLTGKKPGQIFADAGLNPNILGSKRIERATARWKESYYAETLGKYQAWEIRKANSENRKTELEAKRERIKKQRKAYIKRLDKKERQLERQHDIYERKLERQKDETLKKLKKQQEKITKLEAENELLKKVGKKGRRRCEKKVYGKIDLCEILDETIKKYGLHGEKSHLCKILGVPRSTYYYWKASKWKRIMKEEKDEELKYFVKEAYDSCKTYKQGSISINY